MPITARGGLGQKIVTALHSEGAEVPARIVVILHRERAERHGRIMQGRTRIVKSWATLGKAGNAVRQLSNAAARLSYYRRNETRSGEPCRIQLQAWMTDGRRIVVIDDKPTRGGIEWRKGELWDSAEAAGAPPT